MFNFNYTHFIKKNNLISKEECINEFINNFTCKNYKRNWLYNDLSPQEGLSDLVYDYEGYLLAMEFCILPLDSGKTTRVRRNRLKSKTKDRALRSALALRFKNSDKKICYCSVIVEGPEIVEVFELIS